MSRDGVPIHLKCAPKLEAERALRKSEEHLDGYILCFAESVAETPDPA